MRWSHGRRLLLLKILLGVLLFTITFVIGYAVGYSIHSKPQDNNGGTIEDVTTFSPDVSTGVDGSGDGYL